MQNIFLKLDGIKGESVSAQGKDQIEILAVSHAVSMPTTHSGGSGPSVKHGRTVHQDLTVTKYMDITSPTLNLKCSGGTNIKSANVAAVDSRSTIVRTLSKTVRTNELAAGGGLLQRLGWASRQAGLCLES